MTYKPGWALYVLLSGDNIVLEARAAVKDVDNPKNIITITQVRYMDSRYVEDYVLRDDNQLQRVVLELIEEIERHEIREWLKFSGIKVFDPHAEKK